MRGLDIGSSAQKFWTNALNSTHDMQYQPQIETDFPNLKLLIIFFANIS